MFRNMLRAAKKADVDVDISRKALKAAQNSIATNIREHLYELFSPPNYTRRPKVNEMMIACNGDLVFPELFSKEKSMYDSRVQKRVGKRKREESGELQQSVAPSSSDDDTDIDI